MLDRTADYGGSRWRGRVVNVMDPKQQGRLQVRIFGLHDNETLIPDKELPWAVPRSQWGASLLGVGSSPVGAVVGTIVDGYFADSERTILVATGTLQSAGTTKTGQIVDGSYVIDQKNNDMANAARGQDLNAALGLKNLIAISQVGAVFPAVSAGVGYLTSYSPGILNLLSQVDPNNLSGAMVNSVTGFAKNTVMNNLSSFAQTYPGGMSAITNVLGLVSAGQIALTSLPVQLQSLVAQYPGGLSSLLNLTTSLSSVNSLLSLNVASTINQAINAASSLGSTLTSSINQIISTLVSVNKSREFAIEAAEPSPPPQADPPTSTSSKASTKPSSNTAIASSNPYLISAQSEAQFIEANAAPATDEFALPATDQTNPTFNTEENVNIMQQLILREQNYIGGSSLPYTGTELTSG